MKRNANRAPSPVVPQIPERQIGQTEYTFPFWVGFFMPTFLFLDALWGKYSEFSKWIHLRISDEIVFAAAVTVCILSIFMYKHFHNREKTIYQITRELLIGVCFSFFVTCFVMIIEKIATK